MNSYTLPVEIKSKFLLIKGFSYEDLIFAAIYFLLFFLISETGLIHSSLVLYYYILNVLIAVSLVAPTASPQRKVYLLLIYRLKKSREPQRYFGAEAQKKGDMDLV